MKQQSWARGESEFFRCLQSRQEAPKEEQLDELRHLLLVKKERFPFSFLLPSFFSFPPSSLPLSNIPCYCPVVPPLLPCLADEENNFFFVFLFD